MTEEKIIQKVTDMLKDAGLGKHFKVSVWADWDIIVKIPCTEFGSWTEGLDEYYSQLFHDVNKTSGYHVFSNVLTEDYEKGTLRIGWNDYLLPHTPSVSDFREEVLALVPTIRKAGFEPWQKYMPFHFKKVADYDRKAGRTDHYDAVCIVLKSDFLSKWRDEQYEAHSWEVEAEHRAEREMEMRYEDMVCGTSNI